MFRAARLPADTTIVPHASCMCSCCIKTKELDNDDEKYSTEITKIKEMKTKEMSIIELAESEANKSSQNVMEINESEGTSKNVNKIEAKKARIFPFYVNKNCKHGLKGNGCMYEHPKICKFHAKLGDNRRGGCKKGDKCKFAHLKICWQAQGGWICSRKICHFLHPTAAKKMNLPESVRGKWKISTCQEGLPLIQG